MSHIAAVLPLPRRRLLFSALVIGSVAPDLPHLVILHQLSHHGHTPLGILTVSLPFGIAAFAVFQLLLRRPLLALSPDEFRLRLGRESPSVSELLSKTHWILTSLLIGIATHLAWDSFTHGDGYLVLHSSLLQNGTPFWPYRPVYKFLQPFFSLLGLAIIAFSLRRWVRTTSAGNPDAVPPFSSQRNRIAILALGTIAVLAAGIAYAAVSSLDTPVGFWSFLANVLFGCLAAGFFALMCYSIAWHFLCGRV